MIQQGPEINYTSLTSADPTSKPKMAGSGKLKFAYNTGVEKGLTYTKFRRSGHVTVILEAENWQKVDKFELAYHLGSNNTDVDEKHLWCLNTLLTTLLMVMFFYPDTDTIFLQPLSAFKPLNK